MRPFSEKLPFSICPLFGRVYAISTCHSLGKIKMQKNPAIKDDTLKTEVQHSLEKSGQG